MAKPKKNVLVHTGGTFSMGYDREGSLMPLYDPRHAVLAMKVLDLDWDEGQQKVLKQQLVDTRELILEIAEASEKNRPYLKEKLEDELESIAAEISIITGGEASLQSIMQEYRIHSVSHMPYMIDGAEFSIREHYPQLKKDVFEILEAGHVPIVTLGSDTAEFVGPLLAMDLARHGMQMSHTVICLSSMIPFSDNPLHSAKMLQSAIEFSTHGIPGAFTLSARDVSAEVVDVHDLLDGFKKIATNMPNTFRTREPVGMLIRNIGFTPSNMGYMPSSRQMPINEQEGFAYVAPPVQLDKDLHAAIHYLEAFPNMHVVLEIHDRTAFGPDVQQYLLALVNERVHRGIATILVNPLFYNAAEDKMQVRVAESIWKESAFVRQFTSAGGVVRVGHQVSEVYLEAVLSLGAVEFLEAKDRLRRAYGVVLGVAEISAQRPDIKRPEAVKMHYVPDPEMFEHALSIADKIADRLVIEDTPGGIIPARHIDKLEEIISHGHKIEMTESDIMQMASAHGGKNRALYKASKAFMQMLERAASQISSSLVKSS